LAEADVRGRRAGDLPELLEDVALFAELCREEGCLSVPRAFPTVHTRFVYFRAGNRPPDVEVYDDTVCEAVLMHGIPAAGKDTWIERNGEGWPVVSLDQLRAELEVDPADAQGPVAQRARELAKEHLRAKRPFVLNATTLSRDLRNRWIDLFADYRARIRIVWVEAPYATVLERNRRRSAPVPERVIEKLIDRWETPEPEESHRVDWQCA
jgi:predicted kinase